MSPSRVACSWKQTEGKHEDRTRDTARAAWHCRPAVGMRWGSEPEPESEAGTLFGEVVTASCDGPGSWWPESILWEKENTSAWRDAQLFANRILGEVEVPAWKRWRSPFWTMKGRAMEGRWLFGYRWRTSRQTIAYRCRRSVDSGESPTTG